MVKAKIKTIKWPVHLYWDVKPGAKLSEAALLERVLNYGNWQEVQDLINSLGIEKAAKIFQQQLKSDRCNYRPIIANYFKIYFKNNIPKYKKL